MFLAIFCFTAGVVFGCAVMALGHRVLTGETPSDVMYRSINRQTGR
jgi:hypothetical protein